MKKEPRQPRFHTIFRDASVFESPDPAQEWKEKEWGDTRFIPDYYSLSDFKRVVDQPAKDWSCLPFHDEETPAVEETPKWVDNGVLPAELWRNIFYWRFRFMNNDFLRRLREIISFYDDLSFGIHAMNHLDYGVIISNFSHQNRGPTNAISSQMNWREMMAQPDINLRNLLDSSILLQCDETIRYLTGAYEYRLSIDEHWRFLERSDYNYEEAFHNFKTLTFGDSAQDLNDLACFIWYNLGFQNSKITRKAFAFPKEPVTLVKAYGGKNTTNHLMRQKPTETGVYGARPAYDRRILTVDGSFDSTILKKRGKRLSWLLESHAVAIASGRMLQHFLGAQKHFWSHYRWFLTLHPNRIAAHTDSALEKYEKELKVAKDSIEQLKGRERNQKSYETSLERVNRDLSSEVFKLRTQLEHACRQQRSIYERMQQFASENLAKDMNIPTTRKSTHQLDPMEGTLGPPQLGLTVNRQGTITSVSAVQPGTYSGLPSTYSWLHRGIGEKSRRE